MEPVVVKISGALTGDSGSIDLLARYVTDSLQNGTPIVLVHGGGKQINTLSERLAIPIVQHEGRRVTTPEAMDVLLYTVGGMVNRTLVADLRSRGLHAVGLTGADGDLTTAHRRKPLRIGENLVDFQQVGELDSVNPKLLTDLLQSGYLPVVACLTWSAQDGMLNINADTFAIAVALALRSKELVMLMEPEAVQNAHKESITTLDRSQCDAGIREGWIRDGMIPKLHTGFQAIEKGVNQVRLTNPNGLATNSGTLLLSNSTP